MEDEKVVCLRLVAEMDNGKVYAAELSHEESEQLHKAVFEIVRGGLRIHHVAFGNVMDMVPHQKANKVYV